MKKALLVLLAGVACCLHARVQAQLSLFDSLAYQYQIGINGTVSRGNIERLLVRPSGEFARMGKKVAFKTVNTYTYGTILRNKTEDDLSSANFLYYAPFAKLSPYLKLWGETNFRRQKNYAYQTGLGLTYTPVLQADHILKLSANISFEESDFKSSGFIRPFSENSLYQTPKIQLWRYLLRVFGQSKFLEDKLIWSYDLWGQPAIQDFYNRRLHFQSSLQIRIHQQFYFQGQMNYAHESLTLEGIKNYDLFGTLGFMWGHF